MRQQMDQAPNLLEKNRRVAVLEALREVCFHRDWGLRAAHVRTNHVHVVVEAEVRPEKVMNAFKPYDSRGLNQLGIDGPDRKRWALDGYGKMRTSRKLSVTSFRDKANQWKFTWETCFRLPLPYGHGSLRLPLLCRALLVLIARLNPNADGISSS